MSSHKKKRKKNLPMPNVKSCSCTNLNAFADHLNNTNSILFLCFFSLRSMSYKLGMGVSCMRGRISGNSHMHGWFVLCTNRELFSVKTRETPDEMNTHLMHNTNLLLSKKDACSASESLERGTFFPDRPDLYTAHTRAYTLAMHIHKFFFLKILTI